MNETLMSFLFSMSGNFDKSEVELEPCGNKRQYVKWLSEAWKSNVSEL